MKSVLTFAITIFTLTPVAHAIAPSLPEFRTSCTISLIGTASNVVQQTETSPALPAADGPRVSFDLGDSKLMSYVQSVKPEGRTDFEPELSVALFNKSLGPVVGQINLAGLSNLSPLSVGQKSTTFSRSFLRITYNGQTFSRIDYSCSIERTK